MSKLDLKDYTDREIVSALVKMDFIKLLSIMNAIGDIAQRQEKRGKLLSKELSDEAIENLFKGLF